MNLKKDYWQELKEEDSFTVKYDLSIIFRRKAIVNKIRHKSGTLLDLGCGIEFFLYEGLENFDRYGLDLAISSFHEMRKNKLICGINGSFVVADAGKIPFKDKVFDVVISSNSFDHISSPVECIKEIYRILKSGGEFIVCVPACLKGGLKAHRHISDIYTPEKLRDISKDYFYLDNFEYVMFFYNLVWTKVLFLLSFLHGFCHKISFSKKMTNFYDSRLYINFCKIFKMPFNFVDTLFSKLKVPLMRRGYLLARFIKK